MPHDRAVPVVLSAGERRVLKKRARGGRSRTGLLRKMSARSSRPAKLQVNGMLDCE
jgi:hypothetical protein